MSNEPKEPIVIEGKDNIRLFTLLQVASALALEINSPGMRISSRGSALDAARIQGVIPRGKRYTKKQALEIAVELIKTADPGYEPKSTIARALAK